MTIFYFTGTGNSLAVARGIATEDAKLISIARYDGPKTYVDDVIGVAFPVYAQNLPAIVTRFLNSVTLRAEYLFAVATHGGDPGNIGGILRGLATFNNAYYIEMWSNYLPFNPDTPPVAPDVRNEIRKTAECVQLREQALFTLIAPLAFETAPWAAQSLEYRLRPDCTRCGTCALVCPVANITRDDSGAPVFSDRCEGCMACLQNCPAAAIYMPNERTRYRYRNPKISLEDIIKANRQI